MDEGIAELTALQSENTLKISRNVAQIKDDDQGLKALLGASNGMSFMLTSNPNISQVRHKWFMF